MGLEVSKSPHMRGRPSKVNAMPTIALSIRIRVALQRPSLAIERTVASVRMVQPVKMRAVSGVNFQGANEIKIAGLKNTIRKNNIPRIDIIPKPMRTKDEKCTSLSSRSLEAVARFCHQINGTRNGVMA